MAVEDTFDNLLEDMAGFVLGKVSDADNPLEELSSLANLKAQVDVSFVFIGLEKLDNVRVVKAL